LKINRGRTIIIEEPELNLFPKAQKSIMEFFTESINKYDNQFILPTHSPYVLTSLENLMYAHKLGNFSEGKYKKQVNSIIEEEYWIDHKNVSVYYLDEENEIDLMDHEEALINKEYIDSVSNTINNVFDKLLEIEMLIEKEIKG
jgi:predicted ATPase